MTLKQGQIHQTQYELLDPKLSYYNTAKFKKTRLNSVREKDNNKVFVKLGNISDLPWICAKVENSGTFMTCLMYLTILTQFQLNWIKTWNFQLKLFDTAVTLK